MFGILTILLPLVGATLGSIAYHNKKSGALATLFLLGASGAYLIRNAAFPFFVLPHIVAAVTVLLLLLNRSKKVEVPLYAFVSTMCEQGMMMIFAVHILGLPWQVFVGILPLMLYERLVGTVGSTFVILALRKAGAERRTQ